MNTPAALVAQLQQITADLDGYLDRRARELAAPIIADLRLQLERAEDLFAEARRQIVNLEDRLDELRVRHGERRDQQVAARRDEQAALPADTRPVPSVAVYDQLLTRTPASGTDQGAPAPHRSGKESTPLIGEGHKRATNRQVDVWKRSFPGRSTADDGPA